VPFSDFGHAVMVFFDCYHLSKASSAMQSRQFKERKKGTRQKEEMNE